METFVGENTEAIFRIKSFCSNYQVDNFVVVYFYAVKCQFDNNSLSLQG